jgi:hypothetical protein
MATARHAATLILALGAFPACSGDVSPDDKARSNDPTNSSDQADGGITGGIGSNSTPPVTTSSGSASSNVAPTSGEGVTPAPTTTTRKPGEVTRFARLTHAQYDNTVRELMGVTTGPSSAFAPDALNGFSFSSSTDFIVDARLAPQYRSAAETLAEQVVLDDEVYAHVVPCAEESEACRDEFIAEFGRRAFRRPLTAAQTTAFTELFDQGGDLIASGNAFGDGVQLVVEAMLQAPSFLYRTEMSTTQDDQGRVALDDYDVASRLSYFLYNSMPDAELFAAAADGQLHTVDAISTQVARMLEQPRALTQIVSFHEQAWLFNRYNNIAPDPKAFPDVPSDLSQRLLAASRAFVSDVVEEGGGVKEMLTAPYAYADDAMAPLYDVSVDGSLQRIELDPEQRLGLLGQAGFLAANAYAQKTDPIHRGLFVVRELLCRGIGSPPAGASMAELPEGSPQPKTTREEVTLLTSPDGCAPCHKLFNEVGFAFEGFDAVGQMRTAENGEPVNTAGTVLIDGAQLQISGALDLIQALAASDEAKLCYAKKWFTFAHGRNVVAADMPAIQPLAVDMSARDIAAAIVSDPSYLTRPAVEAAQ